MHRVFITYHHANDQPYKDQLVSLGRIYEIFEDWSVDTGDISDELSDEQIRQQIRDEYLRESTVTVVLVGLETNRRKHVDWEIYSSMYDGAVNKKSGILVVNLPTIDCSHFTAAHGDEEKQFLYPPDTSWTKITEKSEYESRYPHMPHRIIDNLITHQAYISVVSWDKVESRPDYLGYLVEATFRDRTKCEYDLRRPMRRANS